MTMIRPETEMKDSGVQWLGNVPKEWSVGKVKHEFYATKTIVGDKANDYERLALTLNGVIKRSKDAGDGLQPEKFDGYQILKEHELVFKLIDLANVSTSRVGLSSYTGIVSPAYIVLHHRKDMNPRYGEYYFLSMWMNEVFNHIGGDGVRSALNAKDLLNIPYLKVSSDEQQAIADYLDETCSKIDEIIAEAKASIDEYENLRQSIIYEILTKGPDDNVEMKDSGVEWIGKVPSHWMIGKVKYGTTKVGSGKTPKGGAEVYMTSGVMFLRSQNIYNDGLRLDNPYYISEEIDEEMKNTRVQKNDVLLNITGGSIGRCCIFDGSIPNANVNQHVCIIRVNSSVFLPEYMHLFWISPIGQISIKSYQTGGNREGMSAEAIKNTPIPIIPIGEQRRIVDLIKPKIDDFNSLISEKESLINDLEAYKKSLIYEVVTGKRRVV